MVRSAVRVLLSRLQLLPGARVGGAGRRLGRCPGCLTSVFEEDAYVRRGGEVFHAEPCVEISPWAFGRATER